MYQIIFRLCMPNFSLCVTQVPASRTWGGIQKRALSLSSQGFLTTTLCLADIDCMRVHHEQISNQLFQSVVNNPFYKIHGLLPKKCNRPSYNLRRQKILDLHKTKTKRFADTFINKSSSMVIYSWLTGYILRSFLNYNVVISNVSNFYIC